MCLNYLKNKIGHLFGSRDTALIACEDKLKKTEELLKVREKMAAIGLLTAGIAHEIKNPLNFVNNFARLNMELLKELKDEIEQITAHIEKSNPPKEWVDAKATIDAIIADIQVNCEKIQEHGQRAESTAHNMLAQSRQQEPTEKESVSINKLLEDYANLAYHGMRALNTNYNIKFEKNLDPNIPSIKIFPNAMGRVFLNIINNGMYAANQKRENLSEPATFTPTVTLTTLDEPNQVVIKIKDNGTGIPESQRQKIFEPLFTTKPPGKGTGLGLAICHDIVVKNHGGELKVDSAVGDYTEFTIILPKLNT
jgi:signal transduction histidine kinase